MRNLWACKISRNPSVDMYGDFGFVNNVIFNWLNRSADGANLPKRDAVDKRIIKQVAIGQIFYNKNSKADVSSPYIKRRLAPDSYKLGIIADPEQVGGYQVYKGTPYLDKDNDGMPDSWETMHGLNASDANDSTLDRDNDGYSNIEEFINSAVPL